MQKDYPNINYKSIKIANTYDTFLEFLIFYQRLLYNK